MVRRRLFGSLPHGIRGDFKVFEWATPRFHRICGDPRVPVQLVDGEVSVLDRWQDRRKLHVCTWCQPEFQPVESHRHAPGYSASESLGKKIWNFETTVVDSIAPRLVRPVA